MGFLSRIFKTSAGRRRALIATVAVSAVAAAVFGLTGGFGSHAKPASTTPALAPNVGQLAAPSCEGEPGCTIYSPKANDLTALALPYKTAAGTNDRVTFEGTINVQTASGGTCSIGTAQITGPVMATLADGIEISSNGSLNPSPMTLAFSGRTLAREFQTAVLKHLPVNFTVVSERDVCGLPGYSVVTGLRLGSAPRA